MLPKSSETKQKASLSKNKRGKEALTFSQSLQGRGEYKICHRKCNFTPTGTLRTDCAGWHGCSLHYRSSSAKTVIMNLEIFLKSLLPKKEISAPLTGFYLELLNGENLFNRKNAFPSHLCDTFQTK